MYFLLRDNRYRFLDKSVGISTLFEIENDSVVDGSSQIVETLRPLPVPGVDGLLIPSHTRGQVLKVLGSNTALVRWEVNGLSSKCCRIVRSVGFF